MNFKEGFNILASSGINPEDIFDMIEKVYIPLSRNEKILGQSPNPDWEINDERKFMQTYRLQKDGRTFHVELIITKTNFVYRMVMTEVPNARDYIYDSGVISLFGLGGTPIYPERFKKILEKTVKECEEVYNSKTSVISRKTLKGSRKRTGEMDTESFDSYLGYLSALNLFGKQSQHKIEHDIYKRNIHVFSWKFDKYEYIIELAQDIPYSSQRLEVNHKFDELRDWSWSIVLEKQDKPISLNEFKEKMNESVSECKEYLAENYNYVASRKKNASCEDYLSILLPYEKEAGYWSVNDKTSDGFILDFSLEKNGVVSDNTVEFSFNERTYTFMGKTYRDVLDGEVVKEDIEKYNISTLEKFLQDFKEFFLGRMFVSRKKVSSDLDKKVLEVLEDLQSRGFVSYEVINNKPGHVQLNAIKETEEEPLVNFITYYISIICKSEQSIQLIMKAEQYSVENKKYNKVANSDFDRLYSIIENFMINAEDELSLEGDKLYNKMLGIYLKVAEEEISLFAGQNVDSTLYPDGFEVKCDFIRNKNLYHLLISLDRETVKIACASDNDFEDEEYEVIYSFNINKNKYMTGLQFKVAIIDALRKVDDYSCSKK